MGIINKWTILYFLSTVFFIFVLSSSDVKAESLMRSSSLQKISTVEGNVERIDYLDNEGRITDAADKHYATVIKTKGEHQLLEEYYDANEDPAKQSLGNYALLREYDEEDQEYKITYLGIDGKPMMNSNGYSSVIRFFYEDGKVEKELYYDTNEKPVKSRYDGYGIYKEYDENGKNILIIHLDENGKPMIAGNGYAIIHRTFYVDGTSAGRVKEEFYFDDHDKPISLSLGQFGLYKEYDELGRTNVLTYLDAGGKPVKTTKGYATIKRTFYEDDTVKTEMYFDEEGCPVRLSEGQYGILKQDGKTIYLDANGNQLFELKNFLINNQFAVIVVVLILVLISSFCGKKINLALLALYILFIIYITLIQRNDVKTGIELRPLWSYMQFFSSKELRWEILNNLLLFVPLGAVLYRIYPRKIILMIPVVVSVFIELTQYLTGTGLCEFDDIISNGLGGVIGYGMGRGFSKLIQLLL